MQRPPSVLLVLPQLPQDPASGAARSLKTACEMLSGAGFAVRSLATTAGGGAQWQDPAAYLRVQDLAVNVTRKHGQRPELAIEQRGISYRLLDTGRASVAGWQRLYNRQFDLMFDEELGRF